MHHLHVHTVYSVGDALGTSSEYVQNMPPESALAITDHNTLAGVVDHHRACKGTDVQPIYGMEVTLEKGGHITLLAKNEEGYKNLCYISHRPKTRHVLANFSSGLIWMSGDLSSPVAEACLKEDKEQLKSWVTWARDVYGSDAYLEVMRHGWPEQKKVNTVYDRLNMPSVRTHDVHYVRQEDAKPHAVLIADQLDRHVDLGTVTDHGMTQAYLVDMPHDPVADEIVNKCTFELPVDDVEPILPSFDPPNDEATDTYIRRKADEALDTIQLYDDRSVYEDRLDKELSVVESMNYIGYYLIVADFIAHARKNNIPVGPGRGSGAGSLLAYLLDITGIDPIRRGLLFERFLNPERQSMPDFDIDFPQKDRDVVIDYVHDTYGDTCVAPIRTYGKFQARQAFKAVARVLEIPASFQDDFADTYLPTTKESGNLSDLMASNGLDDAIEEHPRTEPCLVYGARLEGAFRNKSLHPAGFVITPQSVDTYAPLSEEDNAVQYGMEDAEALGLVKFDFLGLKALDVIDYTEQLVGHDIDIEYNDDDVYEEIFQSGRTIGVFQFWADGMRDMVREMKPTHFDDIRAANALWRPGPKDAGMVDTYIQRKHGREPVTYPHEDLEDILDETYGVIVYQEQVMQIARQIAGFSLGEADILRRAMGKKKQKVMDRKYDDFVQGARKKGYSQSLADDLWNQIETFAAYGFNKSHATAYADIAYQTAYLKCHYEPAFMAAQMEVRNSNRDRLMRLMRDASCGMLEPNVQKSAFHYTVEDGAVRMGLKHIKHLDDETARNVASHRPYDDVADLATSVDISSSALECLVSSGALDALMGAETLKEKQYKRGAVSHQKDALAETSDIIHNSTQQMLFGVDELGVGVDYTKGDAWSKIELAQHEYHVLERYRSFHPARLLKKKVHVSLFPCCDYEDDQKATADHLSIGGVVRDIYTYTIEDRNEDMAFVTIEDETGVQDVTIFPDDWSPEMINEEDVVWFDVRRDSYQGETTAEYVRHKIVDLQAADESSIETPDFARTIEAS